MADRETLRAGLVVGLENTKAGYIFPSVEGHEVAHHGLRPRLGAAGGRAEWIDGVDGGIVGDPGVVIVFILLLLLRHYGTEERECWWRKRTWCSASFQSFCT